MTLRSAPPINLSRPPKVQAYEPDPTLMEKWTPGLRAGPGRESVTGSRTISSRASAIYASDPTHR